MAFLRMSQGGPAGEAKVRRAKWVEDVNEGGRAQKVPFRGERCMGEFSLGILGCQLFSQTWIIFSRVALIYGHIIYIIIYISIWWGSECWFFSERTSSCGTHKIDSPDLGLWEDGLFPPKLPWHSKMANRTSVLHLVDDVQIVGLNQS